VRWCFFTIAECFASMIRIHSFVFIAEGSVELHNGKISQIKLLAIFGPANKN
jgi:hypothetical protein